MSSNIKITYKWFYILGGDELEANESGDPSFHPDWEIADKEYDSEHEAVAAFDQFCNMCDWSTHNDDYILKKIYNKDYNL